MSTEQLELQNDLTKLIKKPEVTGAVGFEMDEETIRDLMDMAKPYTQDLAEDNI